MPDPFDYYRQVDLGKELVVQFIAMRTAPAPQKYSIRWLPQNEEEQQVDVHRLEVVRGDERGTLFFPEAALAAAVGTPEAMRLLKSRVDRFFDGLRSPAGGTPGERERGSTAVLRSRSEHQRLDM